MIEIETAQDPTSVGTAAATVLYLLAGLLLLCAPAIVIGVWRWAL